MSDENAPGQKAHSHSGARPRERRKPDITAAAIGLLGVLIGGFISTGTNYLLAVRAEKTEAAKLERSKRAELRMAARIVIDQLTATAAAAKLVMQQNDFGPKEVAFPMDSWGQNKAVLARELDFDSFIKTRMAVFRAEGFQILRAGTYGSPRKDYAADGKSFYEAIVLGIAALRPYAQDEKQDSK